MTIHNPSAWTIFLDRDGVINRRIPGHYIDRWSDFEFLPGSLAAIRLLTRLGFRIVVVTNQQGVALGRLRITELEAVHEHMLRAIRQAGGAIAQVYYCPEAAADNPPCRKPNPGMAQQAQRDFPAIRFQQAFMVGDSASDIEFGQGLGMQTALIHTRFDEEQQLQVLKVRHCFKSLLGFANFIWSQTGV
ncbi:MAG: HAD family hydrolase [Bacteroidota bacterium]